MEQDRNLMFKTILKYGELLGLFWAVKYLVFIAHYYWVHFIYLFYILNVGTFLLMYIFYFRLKDANPDKPLRRGKCVSHLMLICLIASVFEAVVMGVHYYILNPNFYDLNIMPLYKAAMEILPYTEDMKVRVLDIVSNKLFYIICEAIRNVFVGLFLGGMIALVTGNRKLTNNEN